MKRKKGIETGRGKKTEKQDLRHDNMAIIFFSQLLIVISSINNRSTKENAQNIILSLIGCHLKLELLLF